MTCLRSPGVAELRFDPSRLWVFLPSSWLRQLLLFSPGVLLGGVKWAVVGKGCWHLPGVREARRRAHGWWQALQSLPLFLLCLGWALCAGGAGLWFTLKGGCLWAVEVAGIVWRLDVGSLFPSL